MTPESLPKLFQPEAARFSLEHLRDHSHLSSRRYRHYRRHLLQMARRLPWEWRSRVAEQGNCAMAGIERSDPRGTLSSKGVATDRQRDKSMLLGLNGTFLSAGQLTPTAFGTNGDVLGVFKEHTRL
jgi:hypothetical protein